MTVNVKNGPLAALAFVLGIDSSNKGSKAKLFNASTSAPTTANDNTQGYFAGQSIWTRTNTRQVYICMDATTNAAVWALLELSDHPGYIAGNWYLPPGVSPFNSGSAPGAGSIRLLPAYTKERMTLSALGVRVTTLSVGGNVQAAIYANNPATGRPTGNALISTASMSTTTAVSVNAAASVQLEPGLYWFATNCDNGTAVFAAPNNNANYMSATIGSATQGNILGFGTGLQGLSVTQTFGTWPDLTSASFTEQAAATSIPIVQFQIGSVP